MKKTLEGVSVWWVCECDAVAAYSYEEAVEWYKNLTGLLDDELYVKEDAEEIPFNYELRESEDNFNTTTVGKVVKEYWKGEPFIAVTTAGY